MVNLFLGCIEKMMERLAIHGLTRRMKLNPSGRLIRIEGLLYGGHGRVDQGQEGTGRGRQDGSKSSWRICSAVFKMLLMFSMLKIINLASVGVLSRRPFIWETVFRVPDPNPLLYSEGEVLTSIKISDVLELKNLSNEDLKKRLASQIYVEDWTDECGKCGYPRPLHKELHCEAACTQKQELPNILKENWKEYRKRIKPILKTLKEDFKKNIQ